MCTPRTHVWSRIAYKLLMTFFKEPFRQWRATTVQRLLWQVTWTKNIYLYMTGDSGLNCREDALNRQLKRLQNFMNLNDYILKQRPVYFLISGIEKLKRPIWNKYYNLQSVINGRKILVWKVEVIGWFHFHGTYTVLRFGQRWFVFYTRFWIWHPLI